VRTILPIDVIGPSLRWGDGNLDSRRGAEDAENHSPQRHAELVSASIVQRSPKGREAKWTLKQVQGDGKHLQQDPSFAVATGSLITVRDMRQSFGNQIS
jgi:hypothetical protein